ncbi:cellulose biosynthesis protein BcsP [Paraburkholderia sp. HP33-1]|uniref:cellulose biosynthesis protein BcsP n=1 Tax=Paraburkholderia sp. HP33-1 TaxID=2883243 RepID=UPI001EF1EC00|nr:cellulose biosynthesis protein BcsP [Paraburkholderia sp. HP33-1]
MSSSSDIEKLFEQFGGDANAYQEIGRENDARSARTRWPLLVTLDLTQPAIPAIGQLREAKAQPPMSVAPRAALQEDTTPKDLASVTRAKAPLFTRQHRRDIPPVPVPVTAAQPATPSGASRFGTGQEPDAATARAPAGGTSSDPAGLGLPVAPAAAASAPIPPAVQPVSPSSAFQFRAPPAQPAEAPSILGKMFAAQSPSASPQTAAPAPATASLESVFDRLRGTPAQGAQAPAGAARGGFGSWLTNGPRRS